MNVPNNYPDYLFRMWIDIKYKTIGRNTPSLPKFPQPSQDSEQNEVSLSSEGNISDLSDEAFKIQKVKLKLFEENINLCCKHISAQRISDAIWLLKYMLKKGEFLDRFPFKATGNRQNWSGLYPGGPLQWFEKPFQKVEKTKNLFDLLSICFMMGLKDNSNTIFGVLNDYSDLEAHLGSRMEIQIGRGNAYYNDKQYLRAEERYFKALKIKKFTKIYQYIGWIKISRLSDQQEGMKYVNKCLKVHPKNRGCLYLKAVQQKYVSVKREMFLELIKKQAYYRVFLDLSAIEEDPQVKANYLKKLLTFEPNNLDTFLEKAYAQIHNAEHAKKYFDRDWGRNDAESVILYFCGEIEFRNGNYEQALEYCQKSLEKGPYNLKNLNLLIDISLQLNDEERELNYCLQYDSLDPYSKETIQFLARTYLKRGMRTEAIPFWKRLVKFTPDDIEMNKQIGQLYYEEGRSQQGLKYLKQAHNLDQGNPKICYLIALCYKKMKVWDEAIKWGLRTEERLDDQLNSNIECFLAEVYEIKCDFAEALKWRQQDVYRTNQLNTQEIMDSIFSKLSVSQAKTLMTTFLEGIQQTQQRVINFAQMGQLFYKIDEYQQAFDCFHMGLKLSTNANTREQVKEYYFISEEPGVLSMVDECNLKSLRVQYQKVLQKQYKPKQEVLKTTQSNLKDLDLKSPVSMKRPVLQKRSIKKKIKFSQQ